MSRLAHLRSERGRLLPDPVGFTYLGVGLAGIAAVLLTL